MPDITGTIAGTISPITGSIETVRSALSFSLWKKHPYTPIGYLFVLKPKVVLSARVNQASFTYPLNQFDYDTVTSGSFANVREGMTLLLGTGPGKSDLGRQRIRVSPDTTTIFIGRSSRGTDDGQLKLLDNAHVTILDDYRVWAKIPYIAPDGTQYKDAAVLPIGYPTRPPPKANGGTPVFAIPANEGTYGSLHFSAATSRPFAPFGPSFGSDVTLSYAWQFDDGTPNLSFDAEVDVEFDEDRRFRWVHLIVADNNSHSHIHHIPTYTARRGADGLLEQNDEGRLIEYFTISRSVTSEGQSVTVDIYEDLSPDDYPEGTLVMYAEEEYYGNTRVADPRFCVKFWGWLGSYNTRLQATERGITNATSITLVDIAGRAKALPAFPQIIENHYQAGLWTQMAYASLDRYLHYLLYWHSTVLELANYTPAISDNIGLYPFPRLASDGQDLWGQVMQRAKAIGYTLTCNTRGELRVRANPMTLPTLSQFEALPPLERLYYRPQTALLTLTTDDYSSATVGVDPIPKHHWIKGSAIQTSGLEARYALAKPLFCAWPGESPGQGVAATEVGEQLRLGQSDLNTYIGNLVAAEFENIYAPFDLDLIHAGEIGIEPADMLPIEVEVDPTKFRRELPFTSAFALPTAVNYTYDPRRGTKKARLTAAWETSGDPAVTVIYNDLNIPIYQQPDLGGDDDIVIDASPLDPPEPSPLPDGSVPGGVMVLLESGLLLRATSFTDDNLPIFEDASPGGTQRGDWEAHYKLQGDYHREDRLLLQHKFGIAACADAWHALPLTWSNIYTIPDGGETTSKTLFARGNYWGVQGSPNRKDFFFWLDHDPLSGSGDDWSLQKTADNFDTIESVRIDSAYTPYTTDYDGITQSWFNSGERGVLWATKDERVYQSNDWGNNWAQVDTRYLRSADDGISDEDIGGGQRKLTLDFTTSMCGVDIDATSTFFSISPYLPLSGSYLNYVSGNGWRTPLRSNGNYNLRYFALGRVIRQETHAVSIIVTYDCAAIDPDNNIGNLAIWRNGTRIGANVSAFVGTNLTHTFSDLNLDIHLGDTLGFLANGLHTPTEGPEDPPLEDSEITIKKIEIIYTGGTPFFFGEFSSELDMPFELPVGHTLNRGNARLGFIEWMEIRQRIKIGSAYYTAPRLDALPFGVATAKLNAKIMYLLYSTLDSTDNLWLSSDAGRTWSARRFPTPAGAATVNCGYHLWDYNPNYLVTFANGDNGETTIQESVDGGITWTDWSALLASALVDLGEDPSPIRSVWLDDPTKRWAADWLLNS